MPCHPTAPVECTVFLLYPAAEPIHIEAMKSANLNLAVTKNAHKREHLARVPAEDAHKAVCLPPYTGFPKGV